MVHNEQGGGLAVVWSRRVQCQLEGIRNGVNALVHKWFAYYLLLSVLEPPSSVTDIDDFVMSPKVGEGGRIRR